MNDVESYIDSLSEEQARDLLVRLVNSLQLAEDEGVFGNESWEGFLEIEVQ